MTFQFMIGAIIGSGLMLSVGRAPAHRLMAAVRQRLWSDGR